MPPSASAACQLPDLPRVPSPPCSPSGDLLEFSSAGAMRRVFSTGDLRVTQSQSTSQAGRLTSDHKQVVTVITPQSSPMSMRHKAGDECRGVSATVTATVFRRPRRPTRPRRSRGPFAHKIGRYSAEERREKIERYRTKRNFDKKSRRSITVTISFPRRTIDLQMQSQYVRVSLMRLLLRSGRTSSV